MPLYQIVSDLYIVQIVAGCTTCDWI